MQIALICIHYGLVETTRVALEKLKTKIGHNLLIVINNSTSDVQELSKIIPGTVLIDNRKNVGFAAAVNQGIQRALKKKDIEGVLLINNDLSFSFGSPDRLAKTFVDKQGAGIVSPVLFHGDRWYDWGGSYSPWTAMVKHRNYEQKPKTVLSVDHVAGAAMLIKREVIEKVGLFDERFFLYYEDLDYCLRAKRAGFTIHINPEVVAEHAVSAGSNVVGRTIHQWRSHIAFVIKHMPRIAYPTAFGIDFIFYPLVLLKLILLGK